MSLDINNLKQLASQYTYLTETKHDKKENIYLRKQGDAFTLEAHRWGIFSKLYRWWHREEFTYDTTVSKVSDLSSSVLQQTKLEVPEGDLKKIREFHSQWCNYHVERYKNKHNLSDVHKIIQATSGSKVQEKVQELSIISKQPPAVKEPSLSLKEKIPSHLLENLKQAGLDDLSEILEKTVNKKASGRRLFDSFLACLEDMEYDIKYNKNCHEYAVVEQELSGLKNDFLTFQKSLSLDYLTEFFDFAVRLGEIHKSYKSIWEKLHMPQDCGKMRVTLIEDNSGRDIVIQKKVMSDQNFIFFAYDPVTKIEIGKIDIHIYRPGDRCPLAVKKLHQQLPLVFVVQVGGGGEEYKGVGTNLMQVAMEEGYAQGCEGRMLLEAVGDSHVFHYRMGLRSADEKLNKELEAAVVEKAERQERGFVSMFLPPEAMKEWKARIKAQPLLEATRQEQVMKLLV